MLGADLLHEYDDISMVCKHFNCSIEYVNERQPWAEWICCLWKSRQIDEHERYYQYALAGGDEKKWKWRFQTPAARAAASAGKNIAESIITQWGSLNNQSGGKMGRPLKGNIEEAAERGIVMRASRLEDGTYVDQDGTPITVPPGYFFVPKKSDGIDG